MSDLMESLTKARPTSSDLLRLWPEPRRRSVLGRAERHRDRRAFSGWRRTAWLAAAAVGGVAVLVPVLGARHQAAASEDLNQLAMAAVSADGPVIAEGTFLHTTTEAVQRNSRIFGDGKTLDTDRECWVRWDGKRWCIDTRPTAGWREFMTFSARERASLSSPTPEFAASLPDDPETLGAYLDEHVSGSNSHEAAIFVAVCDLARSNYLPPETLAAALEVLADVDGVRTEDVTVAGRDAVEVGYRRFFLSLLSEDSVIFDRATGRILAEHQSDPGGTYDLVVTGAEVVTEIPTAVRDGFRTHGEGRVYD
jgi:hypothetical protein